MAELNLYQLRSVGNIKNDAGIKLCDNTSHSNDTKIVTESIKDDSLQDASAEVIRLGKENDTHRNRIDELTLYIQQATEGQFFKLFCEIWSLGLKNSCGIN